MAERLHYYQAIELVYIWAIDDARFKEPTGAISLVSEPDFWRKLYVRRPALKRAIRKYLKYANSFVYLIGRRGQGKTTLVLDIVRQYERHGHIVLYIDVRHDPWFKDIVRMDPHTLKEVLPNLVNSRIISQLQDGKWYRDLSPSKVLKFLMTQPVSSLSLELKDCRDAFVDIRDLLPLSCQGDTFEAWIGALLLNDPTSLILETKRLAIRSIKASDYLLAARWLGAERGVLICFDNIDSIGEHNARDALREYIRDVDKQLGPVPRIIVAVRDENYKAAYADDGRASVHSVNLRSYDEADGILTSGDASTPVFDERVTQRRFDFVQELVTDKRVNLRDDTLTQNLPYLHRTFLEVGHFEDTLGSTCNGNRRRLSAHVSNFIELFYQDIDPRFAGILSEGKASIETHRGSIETQLLIYLMEIAGNLPAARHYNFVRWVDDHKRDGEPVTALARHYILMHFCGILDRRHPLESRVSSNEVLNACRKIGLRDDVVLWHLSEFADGQPDVDQLLESSVAYSPNRPVRDVDQHELLSRARYLATIGSRKMCFAAYLLHKEGRISSFNSKPLEPFSPEVLSKVLGLTVDLAEVELKVLASIRDSMRELHGVHWLAEFRRDFGRQDANTGTGELLTEGLLNSYVKYLASSIKRYGSRGDEVIAAYRYLQNIFENRVDRLASKAEFDPDLLMLQSEFQGGRHNRWRERTTWA